MSKEIICEDCQREIPYSEIENGNAVSEWIPDHCHFGYAVAEKTEWYCSNCK